MGVIRVLVVSGRVFTSEGVANQKTDSCGKNGLSGVLEPTSKLR